MRERRSQREGTVLQNAKRCSTLISLIFANSGIRKIANSEGGRALGSGLEVTVGFYRLL